MTHRTPYIPARRWCVTSRQPLRLRCYCTLTGEWLTGPLSTSEAISHCARLGLAPGSIQTVLGAAILELSGGRKLAPGSMLSEDGARLQDRQHIRGGQDG